MKINGKEFAFNGTKLAYMKKLDECMPKFKAKIEEGTKLIKEEKLYDGAVMQIEAVRELFVGLVGVDVVGDCDDLALAMAYVQDFNEQIEKQREKVAHDYFKRS